MWPWPHLTWMVGGLNERQRLYRGVDCCPGSGRDVNRDAHCSVTSGPTQQGSLRIDIWRRQRNCRRQSGPESGWRHKGKMLKVEPARPTSQGKLWSRGKTLRWGQRTRDEDADASPCCWDGPTAIWLFLLERGGCLAACSVHPRSHQPWAPLVFELNWVQ